MERVLGLVLLALSMSFTAFADEIRIPFAVYMEEFKADCLKNGLDLYDEKESHGFIEKRGGEFSVFTYKSATLEQMELIKNLTWKHIRK